ncbi:MAG: ribosome maturation factor RimM [Deltaproteobacteria bacterium]|nr:ribosome maturation factor RimM [Deltaproteobacteria bacterium]
MTRRDSGRNALIEVGRVAGTHGVAGRIRVAPFSGDPSGLIRVPRLRLRGGAGEKGAGTDFAVKAAQRGGSGCAVFLLEGIASAEAARGWTGAAVFVRREDLPPTEKDEYYFVDLVGCEVVDAGGGTIGVVIGVTPGPAHDWLEIRRPDGEALLPMVERFVREVDVARRRIVAVPPPGW